MQLVEECQNAPIMDKPLCLKSYFSITTDLIYSTKIVIEKFLHLEKKWVEKYVNPVTALELWVFKVAKEYGLISMFDLVFLRNKRFDFCVQYLGLNLFASVGLFRSKNLFFYLIVESWWTRNAKRWYQSSHASIFQIILFASRFFHFSVDVVTGSSYLRQNSRL